MMTYKVLKRSQVNDSEGYQLVVIRGEDIESIRVWRNEQIHVLRQNYPIAEEEQTEYFERTIWPSFDEPEPKQILFSFLHRGKCIGYGGIIAINWESKRGEVSFLVETPRLHNVDNYTNDFTHFLHLLCQIAFKDLQFHRLFTETFAFRLEHIKVLEDFGFKEEGMLREHVFKHNRWYDSFLHGILLKEYQHAF